MKVNNYLKKSCKDETNIYYLEQDCNWVHKDQSLNTLLYFTDYLHIIEPGNNKLASKIVEILMKLDCKNLSFTSTSSSKSVWSLSSLSSLPPSLATPSALSPPSSLPPPSSLLLPCASLSSPLFLSTSQSLSLVSTWPPSLGHHHCYYYLYHQLYCHCNQLWSCHPQNQDHNLL